MAAPTRDKAAKYITPPKRPFTIRNARLFYAFKTWDLILSALGKLARGQEIRRAPRGSSGPVVATAPT